MSNVMKTTTKKNPPSKVKVMFNIDAEADAMLDQLTDNRSWLINKWIRDAYIRDFSAEQHGKELRKQPPERKNTGATQAA